MHLPRLSLPRPVRSLLRLLRLPFVLLPELVLLVLDFLLPPFLSRQLLPQPKDEYAPHLKAGFEGWYTRIRLDEGGDVVLILCTVRDVPGGEKMEKGGKGEGRGRYVHFSYHPPARGGAEAEVTSDEAAEDDGAGEVNGKPSAQNDRVGKMVYDFFPSSIEESLLPEEPGSVYQPFTLYAPGVCDFQRTTSGVSCFVHLPGGLYAKVKVQEMLPLHEGKTKELSTPEGKWARLGEGLPLHWHVLSLAGEAEVELWRTSAGEEEEDDDGYRQNGRSGNGRLGCLLRATGTAHCEKNWGISFPSGWVWSQASSLFKSPSAQGAAFAVAGGHILGLRAFLLVFRSAATGREWDFRPPWTVSLFGGRLGLVREKVDRDGGGVELEVRDWWRKVVVRVKSTEPKEDWVMLQCPLAIGHRPFASETFTAHATVDAFERRSLPVWGGWLDWCVGSGKWEWVESHEWDDAAFELGGDYR